MMIILYYHQTLYHNLPSIDNLSLLPHMIQISTGIPNLSVVSEVRTTQSERMVDTNASNPTEDLTTMGYTF